jgi:hypothetical protein
MIMSIGRLTGESRAALREHAEHPTEDAALGQVLTQQLRDCCPDDPTDTATATDSREQVKLRGEGTQSWRYHDVCQRLLRAQSLIFNL